jgi:hypothetical protein
MPSAYLLLVVVIQTWRWVDVLTILSNHPCDLCSFHCNLLCFYFPWLLTPHSPTQILHIALPIQPKTPSPPLLIVTLLVCFFLNTSLGDPQLSFCPILPLRILYNLTTSHQLLVRTYFIPWLLQSVCNFYPCQRLQMIHVKAYSV